MEIKTSGLSNSEKRGVGGNPLHEMSAGGRSQLVTLIATVVTRMDTPKSGIRSETGTE